MNALQLANDFLTMAPRPASVEDAQELVASALAFCPAGSRWAFVVPTAWFSIFAHHDRATTITIESGASNARVVEVRS